jgi:transposase
MKNKPITDTHVTTTKSQTAGKAKRIKLGIDVHADSYRVVRQIDNATPQPAQKFTPEKFLDWAKKQLDQADEVYTCYEAGPFGYSLHRKLEELGIRNVVVRPQDWDELHKGVKTDKTDALALVQRLSRYVDGNTKELAVIRVPTPAQELARSHSRQREQLLQHRLRLEAQGRSLLLYYGHRVKGRWWNESFWKDLQLKLQKELVELLTLLRDLLLLVHGKLEAATKRLQNAATKQPSGVGALTSQVLEREILDWSRFANRRQVGSLTGMCPGVHASGGHSRMGPITKHGNRRIRTALIELAWRSVRFQPEYPPIKKWKAVLGNTKATGAAKKKAIVAVGRKLAIDLWRINTGRATAEKLGLK